MVCILIPGGAARSMRAVLHRTIAACRPVFDGLERYWDRRLRRLLWYVLSCTSLGACTTVDRFGGRAVTYNEQMAAARKAIIVQNVLRAADRQPLQFSEVSTVTGQGSFEGGGTGDLPIGGVRAGGQLLYSLMPGAKASGGPSFTVANLNTQAFFNGIIEPIRPEIIAHYASLGYSRDTLLPLLISSIEFDRGGEHYVFHSDPRNVEGYRVFMALLGALMDRGLTFETVEASDPVGPAMTDEDLRSPAVAAALLAAKPEDKVTLAHFEMTDPGVFLAADERQRLAARGVTTFYRMTRRRLSSRYCLAAPTLSLSQVTAGVRSERTGEVQAFRPFSVDGKPFLISPGPGLTCGMGPTATDASRGKDATMVTNVRFGSRSVRSVFAFLGEIVAAERRAGRVDALDVDLAGLGKQRVFALEPAASGELSYRGITYRLTRQPGVIDNSDGTVQLLSELLALYSSAESFPAPSVVSIQQR